MKKFLTGALACALLLSACKPSEILLAKRCQAATVVVNIKATIVKSNKKVEGICSGVYVSPHLILTADHCVDFEKDIKLTDVWVDNVDEQSGKAIVVKLEPKRDLALLATPLRGTPVKLASNVRVGEDCWVVGNPLGLELAVSKGIVSQTDFELSRKNHTEHFLTDCVVLPGNSGGPAFNCRGQLIGIVVRSTSMFGMFGASGLGIVVQINEVRNFLKHIK